MNKITLAILAGLCASIVLADDFKTIDGKEYKNAKVSRVEPDGIVITFSGGVVKIPFTELSPEIQKKYGYDPAAAADFQKQSYEATLARAREVAEANEKRQRYLASLPTPAPTPPPERQPISATMHDSALDQRQTAPQLIYGLVINVVENEGLLVKVTSTAGPERIANGAVVLLRGNFPGFYDHDYIMMTGAVAGSYRYQVEGYNGTIKTVRAFEVRSITKLPY
jgi:hypothetical protein